MKKVYPFSQREYTKQLQKNTAEEYKKQTEKVENNKKSIASNLLKWYHIREIKSLGGYLDVY
mgnify:CR=1 FL=1